MDDELIEAMAWAWMEAEGDANACMRAVLAVVRAHDRDGARYRWLRENRLHPVSHPNGEAYGMSEVIYGDDVDAAIDAAMRAEG